MCTRRIPEESRALLPHMTALGEQPNLEALIGTYFINILISRIIICLSINILIAQIPHCQTQFCTPTGNFTNNVDLVFCGSRVSEKLH